MTEDDDQIPIIEVYHGVGVHDCQSPERVARVKRAIDVVLAETELSVLAAFVADISNPPEARLLAAAKIEAAFAIAADRRDQRPGVDLNAVKALTAGLSSQQWRDPYYFCSLLESCSAPGKRSPERRDEPLSDEG